MGSTLATWLTVIGGLATLVALAGAGTAYFRASYAKATVATLGESNRALLEQVAILKDEREADQKERAAQEARILALERENEVLREVVQGKADIDRVVMVMQDQHHEDVDFRTAWRTEWAARLDHVDGSLAQIKGMLGNARQPVRDRSKP